jgi:large subunit ribosomal protein L31e
MMIVKCLFLFLGAFLISQTVYFGVYFVYACQDVRIDSSLNKFVWKQGVRNVPHRVRVRLSRYSCFHLAVLTLTFISVDLCFSKRNEDEDSSEKLFTSVTVLNIDNEPNVTTVVKE